MKLVIDIPEDLYAQIYSDAEIMIYGGMRSGKTLLATLLRSVRNGTPLDNIKSEITFKAYEKGYADAKKDIREGLEKLTVELSTNEFTSAIMHDFYNNMKIIIEGEKVE